MLHFEGGKPWQKPAPRDWEDNRPYEPLFSLWWSVRRQQIPKPGAGEQMDLSAFVPWAALDRTAPCDGEAAAART